MFILGILSWWYGAGWRRRTTDLREQLTATIDFFSIDLLLRTLFSPFRQISAGKVRGPIGVQMQAFFDRLISRLIGGMVRLFMILMGIVVIIFNSVVGLILLILWGVVPLLPIVGIWLFSTGWIPWSL
jgi:hypothetical protein